MAHTITLLSETDSTEIPARIAGNDLWLPAAALERATGWALTGNGFCRGSVCMPIPPGREAEFTQAGEVNLTALARHCGQELAHDDSQTVWALDLATSARNATRASLEAPDFTLPDLSGRLHSLHEHRGKKVLLASWA